MEYGKDNSFSLKLAAPRRYYNSISDIDQDATLSASEKRDLTSRWKETEANPEPLTEEQLLNRPDVDAEFDDVDRDIKKKPDE